MNDTVPPNADVLAATDAADTKAAAPTTRANERIAAVARLIRDNGGRVPTHAQLLEELRRLGLKTSKGTVMNDLFALGLSHATSAYVPRASSPTAGPPMPASPDY